MLSMVEEARRQTVKELEGQSRPSVPTSTSEVKSDASHVLIDARLIRTRSREDATRVVFLRENSKMDKVQRTLRTCSRWEWSIYIPTLSDYFRHANQPPFR